MAQLAMAIPAIIAGGAKIVGGMQKKAASKEESAELLRQAGEHRATAQREGIEERRQTRITVSKAVAAAAASGGSASDPDVVNRIADIEGEGELNFLKALYEGDTASDRSKAQARMVRKAGQRQLVSSVLSAAGDIGTTTMQMKYG